MLRETDQRGAHNVGNDRFVWYRIALALDAVHNMLERYRLDQDRIYVRTWEKGEGEDEVGGSEADPRFFDGLDFAVFALGNRQYEHFCAMGKLADVALAAYMNRAQFGPGRLHVVDVVIESTPRDAVAQALERRGFRHAVVDLSQPGRLFEDLGVTYIGPVPGHDLVALDSTLPGKPGAEFDSAREEFLPYLERRLAHALEEIEASQNLRKVVGLPFAAQSHRSVRTVWRQARAIACARRSKAPRRWRCPSSSAC